MKENTRKTITLSMAVLTLMQTALPVSAMSGDQLVKNSERGKIEERQLRMLPKNKQLELIELKKELNLTEEEVLFLEAQYLEHCGDPEFVGKGAIIRKIAKVAKPIFRKAEKKFGVKMGQKTLAEFTDYLFEWEGKIQDGIENFLVHKWGWNRKAAHWAAKTIMFIAF